jgi:hypothetical protein
MMPIALLNPNYLRPNTVNMLNMLNLRDEANLLGYPGLSNNQHPVIEIISKTAVNS